MLFLVLPVLYILYVNFTCQINAQNKQCVNCKYFIPYKNNKITSLGLCKMFGSKNYDKSNEKFIYNFAEHCRDDEKLCGKNATFYDEIEKNTKNINNTDETNTNTNTNTNDNNNVTKENVVQMMEDEMKALINDYYKFLRNENDW